MAHIIAAIKNWIEAPSRAVADEYGEGRFKTVLDKSSVQRGRPIFLSSPSKISGQDVDPSDLWPNTTYQFIGWNHPLANKKFRIWQQFQLNRPGPTLPLGRSTSYDILTLDNEKSYKYHRVHSPYCPDFIVSEDDSNPIELPTDYKIIRNFKKLNPDNQ